MTARGGTSAAALAALLLAACADAPPDAVLSCEAAVRVGAAATDILFVVDDSGSMAEEQENLRQNLGAFVQLLAGAPVKNDFRIGVTTTSVSDFDGSTTYADTTRPNTEEPNIGLPFPAGAIVAIAQTPAGLPVDVWGRLVYDPVAYAATNGYGGARFLDATSATLLPDFEANVLVGTAGTGKEQHLAAIRRAVETRVADGTNAGFLRPGARLAIVIVTDEDDCTDPSNGATSNALCHSATVKANTLAPIADFVSFLRGPLAGEQRDPIVAVIAGFDPTTLAPSGCATSFDVPTRLDALLAALGPERSYKGSICDPDFGPGLQAIADLLVPQTVPLEGAPADPRLLVVSVVRGGTPIACPVLAGCAVPGGCDGAVFAPAAGGAPATLTFQGTCRLHSADRVDVRILCAG